MRILLVEDHCDTAESLARLLRRDGHVVQTAALADEALRASGSATFDLLISDIGLPDLDGWELLGRIRRHRDLPAIALSAFTTDEDEARSRAAGFTAHLHKPLHFGLLRKIITGIAEPASGSAAGA
jgi:DNA-binding response OmpR family regulator